MGQAARSEVRAMAQWGRVLPVLALVVLVHHVPRAAEEEDVVPLNDSEAEGWQHTRMVFPQLGDGSGSGSGSGSGLIKKKPYENHLKHNLHSWAVDGGWTPAMEKKLQAAKQVHAVAAQYAKKKTKREEIAELGCPCQGEKYYKFVWNPTKAAMPAPGPGSGSGSGKKGPGCDPSGTKDCDDDPRFGIKAMLKKYGKLGPNSSWVVNGNERKMGRAKGKLKIATIQADAAFKIALPDFRRMQQEMPEFFTNGKCPCPESWTVGDAIALANKKAHDTEEALYAHKRMLWARERKNSGEEAREAAAEAARIKAAAAKKAAAAGSKPGAKPAAKPAATAAAKPAAARL